MVVDDRVLDLRSRPRHLVVGLREFLQVVMPCKHRIDVPLHAALFEHLKNDSGILWVVFVPGVEHRFSEPGLRDGGDADDLGAGDCQTMSDCPVVIASRFEGCAYTATQPIEELNESVEVFGSIRHSEAVTLARSGLDQHCIPVPCDVDCYPVAGGRSIRLVSHDGDLLRS